MLPEAYFEYIYLFHIERDYFECHEILEEHWKKTFPRKRVWQVLIQIAVALYHYRRHNMIGAVKLTKKARNHLPVCRDDLKRLGIDEIRLEMLLEKLLKRLSSQKAYTPVNLPVKYNVIRAAIDRYSK